MHIDKILINNFKNYNTYIAAFTGGINYIFGENGVIWYRNFYVLCFVLAAVIDTTIVWNIAYVVVALVSIPNLIAMFVLRKEMKSLSDNFEVK